jgi:hypothetical protein
MNLEALAIGIGLVVGGVLFGVGIMAALNARSYDRGYRHGLQRGRLVTPSVNGDERAAWHDSRKQLCEANKELAEENERLEGVNTSLHAQVAHLKAQAREDASLNLQLAALMKEAKKTAESGALAGQKAELGRMGVRG